MKSCISMKKLVLSVLWMALLSGLCNVYMNTKKIFGTSMDVALEEVVQKDFQNRYGAELKYSGGLLGRKVKTVTIVMGEGKEVVAFKDSTDEVVAKRLAAQYVLAQIYPIHPDTLNELLQENLKKHGIESNTGIVYTHNGKSQFSGNDSMAVHRPFVCLTQARVLDVKQTVSVQAWISASPWVVVRNMRDGAFWSFLVLLVVLFWASFSSWEVKDPNKVKFKNMLLNKEAKKATINGKECRLRNQQFQLLLMFVEKPNHTLSREEIKRAFWEKEEGAENRVSNLLSTLRQALKDFPECQVAVHDEGTYELMWVETYPLFGHLQKQLTGK